MRRLTIALGILLLLTGWRDHEPAWPSAGPLPDGPVPVPPSHYESVGAGTRSYRPVEPMPWGDVNRRVAPPASDHDGQPVPRHHH